MAGDLAFPAPDATVAAAPERGGDPLAPIVARAGYMMGENVDRSWSADHARAWEGFLEASSRLRRLAGSVLEPHGGLSVSMLGIMGRLSRVETMTLRQTELAAAMGLSLSRVSRIIDILEHRRLVERRPCPADARATNVALTPAGVELTRTAQDAVFAFVQQHFFDLLSDDEVKVLSRVMTHLLETHDRLPGDSSPA